METSARVREQGPIVFLRLIASLVPADVGAGDRDNGQEQGPYRMVFVRPGEVEPGRDGMAGQ